MKFPDIKVTVAPDQQTAVADLTVAVDISGEHDSVVQEMKFTLQKTGGEWLITRVETVRTFSRLRPIFPRHFELCTTAGSFHS